MPGSPFDVCEHLGDLAVADAGQIDPADVSGGAVRSLPAVGPKPRQSLGYRYVPDRWPPARRTSCCSLGNEWEIKT
jgi:hypothetical protein